VWRKGLTLQESFKRYHLEKDGNKECQELLYIDVEFVSIEI
jgi:hypothetical protein